MAIELTGGKSIGTGRSGFSAGACVKLNSTDYLLTCAHGILSVGEQVFSGGELIGTADYWQNGGETDAALSKIDKSKFIPTKKLLGSFTYEELGGDSPIGTIVTRMGKETNGQGQIRFKNIQFIGNKGTYNNTVLFSGPTSVEGDSGGPIIYTDSATGKTYLVGIQCGVDSNGLNAYVPVKNIINKWAITKFQ